MDSFCQEEIALGYYKIDRSEKHQSRAENSSAVYPIRSLNCNSCLINLSLSLSLSLSLFSKRLFQRLKLHSSLSFFVHGFTHASQRIIERNIKIPDKVKNQDSECVVNFLRWSNVPRTSRVSFVSNRNVFSVLSTFIQVYFNV